MARRPLTNSIQVKARNSRAFSRFSTGCGTVLCTLFVMCIHLFLSRRSALFLPEERESRRTGAGCVGAGLSLPLRTAYHRHGPRDAMLWLQHTPHHNTPDPVPVRPFPCVINYAPILDVRKQIFAEGEAREPSTSDASVHEDTPRPRHD